MTDRQRQRIAHQDRPVVGADVDASQRPGVPMEQPLGRLTPTAPEQFEKQRPRWGIVHRSELSEMTPVFGTAQPLKGFSGLLRRAAYATHETRARHWMMLLLADRVDVLEHRLWKAAKLSVAAAGLVLVWKFLRA